MTLKNISVKVMAMYLLPLLKRNFMEWKRLKKEILSKGAFREIRKDDDKTEKIISSEPVAVFYAHWLKSPNTTKTNKELNDKLTNYIKGLYAKELGDEKKMGMLLSKCRIVAGISHKETPKMIKSAMAMQNLTSPNTKSFKEIFESERAFKILAKSSLKNKEWESSAMLMAIYLVHETDASGRKKIIDLARVAIAKRKKELFS